MKSVINKEEMRRDWVLTNWFEKLLFVFGIFWTALYVLSFIAGYISGMINAY